MIDRASWTNGYSVSSFPEFFCPKCHKGILCPPKDLTSLEPRYSSAFHNEVWHDVDMIRLRISTTLVCVYPKCGEVVSFYAVGSVGQDYNDDPNGGYYEYFRTKTIFPSPYIISIPENTPIAVRDAIIIAFDAFWLDFGLSANALRRSVEFLIDELGVKRLYDSGKPVPLTMRIEEISDSNPETHDFCGVLVKLLNQGSHGQIENPDTLFDAFEAYELFLQRMFGAGEARFKELKDKLKSI